MLRAAGEPTRLRILALLRREELAVLELTRVLGQSQPRVSRHLKLLTDAGLVERFPDGAWVFYRLVGAGPARRLAEDMLDLIGEADQSLACDADRLAGISAERADQAASYFAENAERWDEIRAFHTSEASVEAAIVAAAGEGPFDQMIDLGTGSGRMLTLLGTQARSAVGLDLSRQMLNIARSRVAEAGLTCCELRHGDIHGTGLSAGHADIVIVHQVLHYLSEPAAAVAEAARLTAPGGKLLIVDFAPHEYEFLRAEHRHRRLGFSDDEMSRWLQGAGLGRIHVTALPPASGQGVTVKIWSAEREAEPLGKIA
jgi:DNA-binding transcriptional ArsR family regulator/SAM-dependent methyltransferase